MFGIAITPIVKREIEIFHRKDLTKEYHLRCYDASDNCVSEMFLTAEQANAMLQNRMEYSSYDIWEEDC